MGDNKENGIILSQTMEERIAERGGAVLLTINNDQEKPSTLLNLKLAEDGKVGRKQTVLVPQPTNNPQDPLNWSRFKKHAILIVVSFAAFAGDFGSGAGIPPVGLQSQEWHISRVTVTKANNISIIMAGVSGLVWFPLFSFWGRIPVLFWSNLMGFLFTIGCVLAPDFDTFYGLRALQTVTQSVGQTLGLAVIKDIFFLHEHARKVGIWYAIFITSPVLGPLLGNFMIAGLGKWQPVFWLVAAWSAFVICLILVFGDETYYNRTTQAGQPERPSAQLARLERVLGIWQIKTHKNNYYSSLGSCYGRLLEVFLKLVIPMCMFFYAITFMWSVGINVSTSILLETPLHEGGYGFDSRSTGFIYFAPVVAIVIGELFGHHFNDFLAAQYARRHGGLFVPETRLWATYLGAFIMIPGLILVGQTLDHHLSWVGIIFGWGLVQFGILVISVAVVTYVLDCYPAASAEVSALINFARVAAGFSVGYFQQAWGQKQGLNISFALQSVVIAGGLCIVLLLQLRGADLRNWAGPIKCQI